ncbi:MAG TPA: 50S ribosomal protein L13 [Candidatus Hydrogenedentes bacterium]|nr:50S ribosomal protein L13 [Candidatus Hydrogenedentota bacterium]
MRTHVPGQGEITKVWHLIDAEGKSLGRVAAETARLLRGKHKPEYTPFLDCGDAVIIINASKVRITGNKLRQKMYYRHSGYPGGLKETRLDAMMAKHPTRALELAIKGMLPGNRLGRKLATQFRVYAGAEHPHEAQQPVPHEIEQ